MIGMEKSKWVAVEGPANFVCRDEVMQVLKEMKTGHVSLELIAATRRAGIQVMVELCHRWF